MDWHRNGDILNIIFRYLDAKDLVSCSLVCKRWNVISDQNEIWETLFIKECSKMGPNLYRKMKDKSGFHKIKSKYIQLFAQPYMSQFGSVYSQLWYGLSMQTSKIKVLLWTIGLILLSLILLPVIISFDTKDYIIHRSRSLEACKCKCCEERIYGWIKK